MKRLVEEYKKAGPSARGVLVLQQMMPLVGYIVGTSKPVKIKKLSMLPPGEGGAFAQKAIAAAEQIRAATGIDVRELATRAAAASHPPAMTAAPSPPKKKPTSVPPPKA